MPRTAGSKNKRNQDLDALIDKSKLGLVDAYLAVLNGDWQALGYTEASVRKWLPSGIEVEEDRITLDHRMGAMKELMKYRYAQKRSVEVSGPGGKPIEVATQGQLSDESRARLAERRKPKA